GRVVADEGGAVHGAVLGRGVVARRLVLAALVVEGIGDRGAENGVWIADAHHVGCARAGVEVAQQLVGPLALLHLLHAAALAAVALGVEAVAEDDGVGGAGLLAG